MILFKKNIIIKKIFVNTKTKNIMKFYIIISTLLFNAIFGEILNTAIAENSSYELTRKIEEDLKKQNVNLKSIEKKYRKEIEKNINSINPNTSNTNDAVEKSSFEDNFKKVDIKEEFNPFKVNVEKEDIKKEEKKENKKPETIAVELNNNIYDTQNEDIEKIDINKDDDLAQKRNEIIEEFRKKLEENKKKDATIETINKEIIVDDFAVIIEDEDAIGDNLIKNEEDKKLLTDAQAPITIKFEESITEEEYKNRYLNELKESINRKKKEQSKKTDQVISNAKTPAKKETNNQIEIEKVIASKKKNNNYKEIKKDDPEIFNITDTGVSMEILSEKRFNKLFDNRVELLRENIEDTEEFEFLVPIEKQLINFKTSNIPQELLEPHRSNENKHIPFVLKATDFQEIVKNAVDNNDMNVLRGVIELLKEPDYILENGQTVLNYASVSGSTEILKYLLYSGANVNIQDYNGNTPLHNAILREDDKIIKLLVENNSNLDIFNIDGYTPLMLSIVNGKNDISAYLIKFDQDLTQQNYKKETILDLTNKFNRDIIKELVLEKIKETKIEK